MFLRYVQCVRHETLLSGCSRKRESFRRQRTLRRRFGHLGLRNETVLPLERYYRLLWYRPRMQWQTDPCERLVKRRPQQPPSAVLYQTDGSLVSERGQLKGMADPTPFGSGRREIPTR